MYEAYTVYEMYEAKQFLRRKRHIQFIKCMRPKTVHEMYEACMVYEMYDAKNSSRGMRHTQLMKCMRPKTVHKMYEEIHSL